MKLANLDGRATLLVADGAIDLAAASGDRFGPDLQLVYDHWDDFLAFAADLDGHTAAPFDDGELGPPSPAPKQVFAIGLNYRSHATETGAQIPDLPALFTKFPASIAGPFGDVTLSGDMVDWEVELVVVIGRRARNVPESDAWSHVAGLTVGQDFSDRKVQFAAGAQFSMGKSFEGYGPTGPWLVTIDELADPDDVALRCEVDGEVVQDGRTSDLIHSVPSLVAELSAVLPLWPGDLIFTGTPAGVGIARNPARFLRAGEVVTSTIEGIGTIRNTVKDPS